MVDNELLLRRYRTDIHSMCAAFPEPATAYKIRMEFDDNFDDEVPFRQFGYPSLEAFLDDHPDLQRVYVDGKVCYRAKVTAATMEIQALVAKQKKKKKTRGSQGKKNRGGAHNRNGALNRSYKQIPNSNFGISPLAKSRGAKAFNFNSRPPPPPVQQLWGPVKKAPYRSEELMQAPVTLGHLGQFGAQTLPHPPRHMLPVAPPEPVGPEVGVTRMMKALEKCSGKATLTKLNWAYQNLYNVQFNGDEMTRHFGTRNMRTIHRAYLSDKIELNTGYGGQWSFLSKENAQKQKDWDALNKNAVVEVSRVVWAYPTIRELFDKTVEMLVNMYPETIPLDSVEEYYKRAHKVHVDPLNLYSKSWESLFLTTFASKLRLTVDKRIALTAEVVKSHNLNSQATLAHRAPSAVKRVTAETLDLIYLEDEDDEYSDEEGSDDAETLSHHSGNDAPLLSFGQPDTSIFFGSFNSSKLSTSSVFSQPTTREVKPQPERKSIFSRISFPGRTDIPAVRKDAQPHYKDLERSQINLFEQSLLPFETVPLPMGIPSKPSVFARTSTATPPKVHKAVIKTIPTSPVKAQTRTGADQLAEQMKRLAVSQRNEELEHLLMSTPSQDSSSSPRSVGGVSSTRATGFGAPNSSLSPASVLQRAVEVVSSREGTPTPPCASTIQLPPFLKRFEVGQPEISPPPMTLSPGNYKVKLNGRAECLAKMIRSSRQNPTDQYTRKDAAMPPRQDIGDW